MEAEELKQSKIINGKKYDLYTTYLTRQDARKAAETLRNFGERAFTRDTYSGYAVYHRNKYTDER